MKKFILYLLCAGLVGFYIVTFFIGRNLNVSEQYRDFYIDHTVTKWKYGDK